MISLRSHSSPYFIFLVVCLLLPAWSHGEPSVSSEGFHQALSQGIERVEEFKRLKALAKEYGVRMWLFGGTASSFGHYVRWDELRKSGETQFVEQKFNYDFVNIFQSHQDIDIVVDATSDVASKIEQRLKTEFPHFQGGKSAWEVRLLRGGTGGKAGLIGDINFQSQHSDSHSVGLIELSEPPADESRVRDLFHWERVKNSPFERDLLQQKIKYHFSENHEQTERFKKGLNPPIFSAIRYLIKVVQFDLEPRQEDLEKIRQIIQDFRPSRDLSTNYAKNWLERNGKKLIQSAIDVERAINLLDELGVRERLRSLGDVKVEGSLAWWMNKEPLRSFELGRGQGKTAAELNISTISHETNSMASDESIRSSPRGRPNVLISRQGFTGEGAAHGEGWYHRIGRVGTGRSRGLTVRSVLHPDAREGTDFEIASENVVIVKNRNAVQIIPESLEIDPIEFYRKVLDGSLQFAPEDRGIWVRALRRIKIAAGMLNDRKKKKIQSLLDLGLNDLKNPKEIIKALWMSQAHLMKPSAILKAVSEGKVPLDKDDKQWPDLWKILDGKMSRMQKKEAQATADVISAEFKKGKPNAKLLEEYFAHPRSAQQVRLFDELSSVILPFHRISHEKRYGLSGAVAGMLRQPEWQKHDPIYPLVATIVKSQHDLMIYRRVKEILLDKTWVEHPEAESWLNSSYQYAEKNGNPGFIVDFRSFFAREISGSELWVGRKVTNRLLNTMIASRVSAGTLAEKALTHPENINNPKLEQWVWKIVGKDGQMVDIIFRSDQIDGIEALLQHVLPKKELREKPWVVEVFDEIIAHHKGGYVDSKFIWAILMDPYWKNHPKAMVWFRDLWERTKESASTFQAIIHHILADPEWRAKIDAEAMVDYMIATRDSGWQGLIRRKLFEQPYWKHHDRRLVWEDAMKVGLDLRGPILNSHCDPFYNAMSK